MEYNRKYHNCLRLQITEDARAEERISDMVAHCLRYGFDNVMLMINAEDFNRGHITCEAAAAWVDVLCRAADALRAAGISVSLNNWIEMGHADRGMKPYPGQCFTYLVDMYGREATFCTCPLDPAWRRYYMEYVTYLVGRLRPDTFWIEDDFRMQNHQPLRGIGCFCRHHMAEYNRRLGKQYTREEFVRRAFAAGEPTEERRVFLDVSWEGMRSLAAEITEAVKKGNETTEVGLMSSSAESHAMEGRNWDEMFDIISRGGHKLHRIHMCYGEPSGKDYLWYFNAVSMPVRAASPADTVVLPEVEHGPASQFARSPRYLRFALETAMPLVLSGMTYSIYDFIGNGVRESLGFGQTVKSVQPLAQAVMDLGLSFVSLAGVTVPMDPRAAYRLPIREDGQYTDLKAEERQFAAYLSALGVSYAYTREKDIRGQLVLLCADNLSYFTDAQLTALFQNNFILLDGSAVMDLAARGLLSLIGARSARTVAPGTGFHAYEECADPDLVIAGVRGLRASGRASAGDFVDIVYDAPVTVRTDMRNHLLARVANGFSEGKSFAVLPYSMRELHYSQFCDLRRHFLTATVAAHTPRYAIVEKEGVSPYLFEREKDSVLMLTNGNCESYEALTLRLGGVNFSRISRLTREGGREEVAFERTEEGIRITTPIEYYATTVLILE